MQGFLLSISIAVLHNPCFLHLPWKQKKNNERLKHPLDSDNKKIWTHLLNNIALNVI